MRWLQLPEFDTAYCKARRDSLSQAPTRLQQGSYAAATTLLGLNPIDADNVN